MQLQEFMDHDRVSQNEGPTFEASALAEIQWLEQTEADVPVEDQWLSANETISLRGMRFPKRRADWRLGRWTAKNAVAACLNLPAGLAALANIEIRPAESGAPEVLFHDQPAQVGISLSHRSGVALCTVGPRTVSFGCDLETVEPRDAAFIADYFTLAEKTLIQRAPAGERSQLVTLLWSAKESALKALRLGLRTDTTCVSVSLDDTEPPPAPMQWRITFSFPPLATNPDGWRPLRVVYAGAHVFGGWWRLQDQLMRTIVSVFPLPLPNRVQLPNPIETMEPVLSDW